MSVHVESSDFPLEDDTRLIHFHDFENLPHASGESVESPEFTCAGEKWKLVLYPGGRETSKVEI
jgi:hypothetical protein